MELRLHVQRYMKYHGTMDILEQRFFSFDCAKTLSSDSTIALEIRHAKQICYHLTKQANVEVAENYIDKDCVLHSVIKNFDQSGGTDGSDLNVESLMNADIWNPETNFVFCFK